MVRRGEECPTCGEYYDRHTVVDGIVVKDGKILLIRRGNEPGKGLMALPGGYVDWNETTEQAIEREIVEETNIRAKVERLVGVYSDPKREPQDRQNIALTYRLSVVDDRDLKAQEGEVLEIGWYSPENLPGDLAFDHQKMITDYLTLK